MPYANNRNKYQSSNYQEADMHFCSVVHVYTLLTIVIMTEHVPRLSVLEFEVH